MNNLQEKSEELNINILKENNEQNKYKIIYSSYGYINILEEDLKNNLLTMYKFIQYKNNLLNSDTKNNLLKGFIFKDNIKDTINIKVKYFHSKRKLISFNKMNIHSKINILVPALFQTEEYDNNQMKYTKNSQYRLYSCKSGLRELNTSLTFFENNIHDKEILLFFNEVPLLFSTTMKGKSIELSQMGKTALKKYVDDPQYILGNIGYTGGRHYFEIKLMTDPMLRSIVVGFGIKTNEKNLFSNEMKRFYGFILSDMKKIEIVFGEEDNENIIDYGEICSINDIIGVMYDCLEDGVYISFYKNRKFLGIAFEKLSKDELYFPAIEMGLCGSKIQINNDIDFPEE